MSSFYSSNNKNMASKTRLSGPVSAYVYDLPGGRRLHMFGDAHFSYSNMCDACPRTGTECTTIARYIEALRDASRPGKTLDVFMEFPYAPKQGPARDALLSKVDEYFMKNASASTKFKNFILNELLDTNTPVYVGVFHKLYKHFAKDTYQHDRNPRTSASRFHYGDARLEFNVQIMQLKMRSDVSFWKKIDTLPKLRSLWLCFLTADDFVKSVRQVMGSDYPVDKASLSGGRHKIAKQLHKLPAPFQTAVHSYINRRMSALSAFLDDNLGDYSEFVRSLQAVPEDFAEVARLHMSMIFMDVYLLCRMLYYMSLKTSKGGDFVVYAGDMHIQQYASFVEKYMGEKPKTCSIPDASYSSRCQTMQPGSCDTPKYLKRVANKLDAF